MQAGKAVRRGVLLVLAAFFAVLLPLSAAAGSWRPRRLQPPGITPQPRPAPAIPEPAGFALFAVGAGAIGIAALRRRRP